VCDVPKQTVVCRSCGKAFQVDGDLARAFCLYCGAENKFNPPTILGLDVDLMNLPTDPAERRDSLLRLIAADGESAALARDRYLFWAARFEPIGRQAKRYGDKFIEFISLILFYSQNYPSRSAMKRARKDRDRFLGREALRKALTEAVYPLETLQMEFVDAAELYLRACRDDKHYGSRLFELVKLKEKDVAEKAAEDLAVGIMSYLCQLGMTPETDLLIQALHPAYSVVFPKYAELLDEAIARLPNEINAILYRVLARKPILQEDAT
jgi:hypothetical protein